MGYRDDCPLLSLGVLLLSRELYWRTRCLTRRMSRLRMGLKVSTDTTQRFRMDLKMSQVFDFREEHPRSGATVSRSRGVWESIPKLEVVDWLWTSDIYGSDAYGSCSSKHMNTHTSDREKKTLDPNTDWNANKCCPFRPNSPTVQHVSQTPKYKASIHRPMRRA